jgi:hypothetical protein
MMKIIKLFLSRGRSISDWLRLIGVLSISVVDLLAHLLGEGQLNILAGGGSQGCDTLLEGLGDSLNLGDDDAFFLRQVLTADPGQEDGLVDTGLDGLWVDNINSRLHNSQNRDVIASLLGDLLAVVVAIAVVSVSWGWLAHGHHLGVTLLVEGNLNSLSGGGLSLGLVGVGADLVVDLLNALSTDSPGYSVTLLGVNDILAGQLNGSTDSLKSRGAHLGSLDNIENRAVVLGLLIAMVGGLVVDWGMVSRGVGYSMVGNSVVGNDWGSVDSMSHNRGSMGNSGV